MVTSDFVSVIIPILNSNQHLKKCLDRLHKQTYPRHQYEIVVVDNGSDESPFEMLQQYPQARLVIELKAGAYSARNTGLKEANGNIIAFTDADCLPAADWIEKGVYWLSQNRQCGLIGGIVIPMIKNPAKPTCAELFDSVYGYPSDINIEYDHFMPTCNLFTWRKTIDAVGEFDDSLISAGDNDWGNRVFEAGYDLIYAPDVVVAHPTRHDLSLLFQKLCYTSVGEITYMRKIGHLPVMMQRGFLQKLYFLPSPRDIKLLRRANLSFIEKVKVMMVVLLWRIKRIEFLIRALMNKTKFDDCYQSK